MRVLYFHQHFSTPQGSTGIRSYEMAKKLILSGHQVTMVCGTYRGGNTGLLSEYKNGFRRGNVDGIDVIEFELEYSNSQSFAQRINAFIRFSFRCIKLVFTENYDLVFATTTPLTVALPGIVARWLKRKPFVFEVRDLWPELPREMGVIKNPVILAAMGVLEWTAYKSANALIGLSPGIKRGIERLNIPADRIVMIPNGCDLSIFQSQQLQWQPAGVNDTDLMAIFTGTHGVANGLDIIIDTAKELKERRRIDIKIVLVGQGKLKSELVKKAQALQLDNIIFQDPVNKTRLAQLMKRADIGLQLLANVPAFYYGTSPNKFFDYISSGLPVLNNYPGWLADMIRQNDCGYVVPPSDPVAFADTLELAKSENLERKGNNALKLAVREFDRDKLSSKFVIFLESNAK